MNAKPDPSVVELLAQLPLPQRKLAQQLRQLIRKTLPEVREAIKWRMPVFEQDGLLCAIRCTKKYVALQFYGSGTSLADPDNLLEGSGKGCRHYKLRGPAAFQLKLLRSWILYAASFNAAQLAREECRSGEPKRTRRKQKAR